MIDKLSALGIKPCTDRLTAGFELRTADAAALARQRMVDPARPLVSCLMVTRGNPEILRHSADCYAHQSWTNRELVVITGDDKTDRVAAVLREQGADNVTLVGANPGLSLGDLRNMAVARARGDILVQWDDDDLSDPLRIATAVAVLTQTNAAAAFLDRWLIWWPRRNLAAICCRRMCEGTIAIWRNAAPTYPAMARGETPSRWPSWAGPSP